MDSFEDFLDSLRDPAVAESPLSPQRFSEAFQIDLRTLAEQAGLDQNTMTAAQMAEAVQHFMRETLRVIRAATDLSGDLDKAMSWYRSHSIATFSHRTPEQLVAAGRTEDILRYVAVLEAGASG